MEILRTKLWEIIFILFPCLVVLSSCSSDDYINVIPQNSTAIVAVDTQDLFGNSETDKQKSYLKEFLQIKDFNDCGIDVSSRAYIFETVDGNLGLVVKVKDEGTLNEWLDNLHNVGRCKKITKRKDLSFTSVKDKWIIGFSSDAMLVMGPVLPAQQAEMQRQMVKYFEQDEEQSIKFTPLFEKLDSLNTSISIVAQAAALPEKFVAPFTIGAPKDADASQIMIAAEINKDNSECIEIVGETFSFNKNIDGVLKENMKVFRPIKGTYLKSFSYDSSLGVFVNVNGEDFIKLLHSNKSFQALLAGINTAIDMDNIIRSVDGDMAFVFPAFSDINNLPQMSAQLANKDFLKDVDYWKKSCLSGSKITDWDKDSYCYTDGTINYYFGVSVDMQFYSGSTSEAAKESILKSKNALNNDICKKIEGKRICFVLNVDSVLGDGNNANTALSLVKPLLGDVKTVLYSM